MRSTEKRGILMEPTPNAYGVDGVGGEKVAAEAVTGEYPSLPLNFNAARAPHSVDSCADEGTHIFLQL